MKDLFIIERILMASVPSRKMANGPPPEKTAISPYLFPKGIEIVRPEGMRL
jgi:hypothetical protein